MIIISYDIADDRLRRNFSKYIMKYGYRLQYSVYEIINSPKVLANISADIKNRFEKSFSPSDSIIIFNLSNTCEITRFGYARNEESDTIII